MARPTLATMISQARTRADMVGSTFVSDTDVAEMLNSNLSELHEFLVATFEDYFVTSYLLTTISGTDEYDLTAVSPGVFKLRGVDLLLSAAPGNFVALRPFQWGERQRYSSIPSWSAVYGSGSSRPAYHLLGSKLKLAPPPDGGYSLKVWYVPNFVPLDNSVPGTSDVLGVEMKPGWEEYAVMGAAAIMLAKEQNDTSFQLGEKARIKQRIQEMAPNRDAAAPAVMIRRRGDRADRSAFDFPFGED